MRKILILILFLSLCVPEIGYNQDINILSYNIRYASFNDNIENWNKRREGVCEILKGKDFIGLQEVLPVQMEDIKNYFGNEYGYLFRTRNADPNSGEGSPLLYRTSRWEVIKSGYFWLSDTPEIPGSNTWSAAFTRMVSFGLFREKNTGDSILVMNTHFDHISQPARERSINLILKKFKKNMDEFPVIFMGDLNATPDNPVYLKMDMETDMIDSWHMIHKDESETGATFHGWKDQVPEDRIDYIFYSPFLNLKSSEVLHTRYAGNYPSDHFPVFSVFSWGNQE